MYDIPCVFCFDAAFARKAAVAITSLCVHAESSCRIYCLVTEVGDEDRAIIQAIGRRFGQTICFIDVDDQFARWKTSGDYSPAIYYRLLIPSLVSERRAIYLDCDLLVTCDLMPLFEVELGEAWLAGRVDQHAGRNSPIPRLQGEPYVNSGVLLLDLDRLRAEDFLGRSRATYEAHVAHGGGFQWGDQCVINKAAEGRKLLLEQRWNVMAHEKAGTSLSAQARLEPFDGTGILHFSGRIKPWHAWSSAWETALWQSYVRLSGVPRGQPPSPPKTVTQWKDLARKLESEGDWRGASDAYRNLATHFERKLIQLSA
jgi:lipopolysaccharide biosynthesis glycosyltransferase